MLFTRGPRVPRHRREQGSRPGGRLAPPRWWVSKPACIALDQAILLNSAQREPPFFEEKWKSVSPMRIGAVPSVRFVKLLIIERNIISWRPWTTLVKQAFQPRRRKLRQQLEGVVSWRQRRKCRRPQYSGKLLLWALRILSCHLRRRPPGVEIGGAGSAQNVLGW